MKRIPYLHLILFLLTLLSTLVAGAVFQKGINILKEPWRISEGAPFALTLMAILLSHELSHYLASKRHHTKATLPYFIPAPITLIGTFGAFIKMKSPIITRRALIDIGASGPIAGFVLSVIASVIGLSYSTVVPVAETKGIAISLGDSLLYSFLSNLVIGEIPDTHEILLHPVAFAGWLGLFVTSLNLIPIGQLDGGHIAFAFLGKRHEGLSKILVSALLVLGLFSLLRSVADEYQIHLLRWVSELGNRLPIFWEGWIVWGVLLVVLGLKHPPVIYWETPLDGSRRFIGALAVVIFIITFMPSPFRLFELE